MSNPKSINGEDLLDYLKYRVRHLRLEMEKIPFTIEPNLREGVFKKLSAKIYELNKLKHFILGKNFSKVINYEKEKGDYLDKIKIEYLKKKRREIKDER